MIKPANIDFGWNLVCLNNLSMAGRRLKGFSSFRSVENEPKQYVFILPSNLSQCSKFILLQIFLVCIKLVHCNIGHTGNVGKELKGNRQI